MDNVFEEVLADLEVSAVTLELLGGAHAAMAAELRALVERHRNGQTATPQIGAAPAPEPVAVPDPAEELSHDEDDEDDELCYTEDDEDDEEGDNESPSGQTSTVPVLIDLDNLGDSTEDDSSEDDFVEEDFVADEDRDDDPIVVYVAVTLLDGAIVTQSAMYDALAGAARTLGGLGEYTIGSLGSPAARRVAELTFAGPRQGNVSVDGLVQNGLCGIGAVPIAGNTAMISLSRNDPSDDLNGTAAALAGAYGQDDGGEPLPELDVFSVTLQRDDGAEFDAAALATVLPTVIGSLTSALGTIAVEGTVHEQQRVRLRMRITRPGPIAGGYLACGLASWRGSVRFDGVGLVHASASTL